MPRNFLPRKNYTRKTRIIGLIELLILVLFFFILNRIVGIHLFYPLVFLAFGVFFVVFIPSIRRGRRQRKFPPYLELETSFNEEGDLLIDETFGTEIFELLYNEELNEHSAYGIDICRDLLKRPETRSNPVLESHLHAKTAAFSEKEGDWENALESLEKAAALQSDSLVLHYKMAVIYERLGLAGKALESYEAALKSPSLRSLSLKRYVKGQMERIRKHGPRKESRSTVSE